MIIDSSELAAFARDLDKAAHRAIPEITKAVKGSTQRLEEAWRRNARATAGKHGKHYPSAVTSETGFGVGAILGEVGPETGKKQGGMGMGFEFGSRNQTPHLDGTQAADKEEPKFARDIGDAATSVLEAL